MTRDQMKAFKQLRLTANDCEALRQSPEGTAALTQPLTQRPGSRDSCKGLHPIPRRKKRSKGHQRTITDYFRRKSHISKCSNDMAESNKIKVEEPLENFALDWDSDETCILLGDEGNELMTPRKRFCFSQSTSDCYGSAGQGVPENKPLLVGLPEQSSSDGTVKQEVQDVEVDPLPDAHFGLLGTRTGDVPQGTIEELPDEILQQIFALVPVVDLLQNLCRVCHRWKCIISDMKFIPWKKLYYQYLKAVDRAALTVQVILQRYGLTQERTQCMLGFIRCVSAIWSCHCQDPTAILACLKHHSLFLKAQICITKRLPDLEGPKQRIVYALAVMVAIVLFAGGVCDIQELVACLRRPSSTVSLMDILEMLYCMATLLYAMREKNVLISNRIHYNIFSCLYLLENTHCSAAVINPELSSSERGFSNRPALQPTNEQQQILNHALTPGQVVKIVAFAGTGKTSTLIQYAEKWSHLQFLYLAFNKTIAAQGTQVFPPNVTCKTVHSLAFTEVGKRYRHKLNFGSLTSYLVSFVLSNREGQSPFIRAKTVIQTLAAFSLLRINLSPWSTHPFGVRTIKEQKFLFRSRKSKTIKDRRSPCPDYFCLASICQTNRQHAAHEIIIEEANQIWAKMKMLSPTREMAYKMTHDGYLKLWQLQKPSLSNFDVILVDEAQDCTPAIMDIVLSQPCGVILVGDPHQQIYTFRGAVNALSEVPHSHIFYLTQSFRFGSEIAYVGATILDVCKKVRNKTLVGNNHESDVSGIGVEGKVARLSRGNQTVFDDAVNVTNGDPPAKIHLLGGLKAFGLEKVHDLWKLLHPELKLEIKDSFIKRWVEKGLGSIKNYAEKAEDKQLEIKIAIVEKYRERIPELVERISRCHVLAPENADYILGTVHKAKGLEFDTVQVASDFVNIPFTWPYLGRMPQSQPETTLEDEWNLLYVAVTRAKRRLIMPRLLADLLKYAREYYVRFELTSEVCKETSPVWCSEVGCCNSIPADSFLIPKKMNFVYTDSTKTTKGFLCPSCAVQFLGPIAQLTMSPEMVQDTDSPKNSLRFQQWFASSSKVFEFKKIALGIFQENECRENNVERKVSFLMWECCSLEEFLMWCQESPPKGTMCRKGWPPPHSCITMFPSYPGASIKSCHPQS